jgi:hypothetical protein
MGSFKDPTTLGLYTFLCFLLWFQLTTLNPGFDIHAETWVHLKTQHFHVFSPFGSIGNALHTAVYIHAKTWVDLKV